MGSVVRIRMLLLLMVSFVKALGQSKGVCDGMSAGSALTLAHHEPESDDKRTLSRESPARKIGFVSNSWMLLMGFLLQWGMLRESGKDFRMGAPSPSATGRKKDRFGVRVCAGRALNTGGKNAKVWIALFSCSLITQHDEIDDADMKAPRCSK